MNNLSLAGFGQEAAADVGLEALPHEVKVFLFADFDDETITPTSAVMNELTPDNFVSLVRFSTDYYDEPGASRAIHRFAQHATVEFIEPSEELSFVADSVERTISTFVETGQSPGPLRMLKRDDLLQITAIYNANNMLAFAQEVSVVSVEELSSEYLDMIYRYRTILQQLAEHQAALSREIPHEERDKKVGDGTWAGRIRPLYGQVEVCRIDPDDHRDFNDEQDLPRRPLVVVDGKPIEFLRLIRDD